ncbi:MAG: phosphatidate cytidylyltransferase [Hyphomicrobiaceae bacterium]
MPGDNAHNDAATKAAAALASSRNLKQRVGSGVVMALIALALVYAGPVPTAVMVLVVALVMCWEWGHLIRASAADIAFGVHAAAVATAIGLIAGSQPAHALTAILTGTLLVFLLALKTRPLLSALGVPYVGLAAVSLIFMRLDGSNGFAAVVFIIMVVATTDTMAFVFGRTIGGAKLWPAVSPNKTWAGFLGGIGSSALASAAFASLIPGASPLRLGVLGLLLGIIAQGGDLAESALKRFLGVKDASSIIPGHGGVMDRMDGVVTVAFAAAIFALFLKASAPATALLIGG